MSGLFTNLYGQDAASEQIADIAARTAQTSAALTDSSTGAASTTLAAGVGYEILTFSHTFIGGTSAVEPVTTLTLGFKFKIISWTAVVDVLLVGAGGSRTCNMEIGTTDVGTSPSTLVIAEANATVGTVIAGAAVAGANTGSAAATFSIEIASGGTAFSAGKVTFQILVQNMDTADAIASLAAQVNAHTVEVAADIAKDNLIRTNMRAKGWMA